MENEINLIELASCNGAASGVYLVSLAEVSGDTITYAKAYLVNPGIRIRHDCYLKKGISKADIEHAPTFKSLFNRIHETLNKIVIGYLPKNKEWLETLMLEKRLIRPNNFKFENLNERLRNKISNGISHCDNPEKEIKLIAEIYISSKKGGKR